MEDSGNSYEERFRVFRRLLDLCVETKADILLLPGDVLEQDSLSQAELSRVITLLGELVIPDSNAYLTNDASNINTTTNRNINTTTNTNATTTNPTTTTTTTTTTATTTTTNPNTTYATTANTTPTTANTTTTTQVQVFITPGNHDPASPLSAYRKAELWPENVHIFLDAETIALPELGVSVSGAGFRSLYQREPLLPAIIDSYHEAKTSGKLEECPIALALVHGELRHGKAELYNPIDPAELRTAPFAYVALAHVHTPDSAIQGTAGACRYAYSGTIQGSSRKDDGERGCLVLRFNEQGLRESRFAPLAETVYLSAELALDRPEDQEQAVSQLLAQLGEVALAKAAPHKVIWQLTLTGRSSGGYIPDAEALRLRLADEGVRISWLEDRSAPDIDAAKLAEEDSLRGLFYRRLSKQLERSSPDERLVVEEALRLGIDAFRGDLV